MCNEFLLYINSLKIWMSRDPYLVAVIFSYTDDGQIERDLLERTFGVVWCCFQHSNIPDVVTHSFIRKEIEMDNIEIGNRIREIRIKKNISVFELAYRTKTSQSHIYQIEGGSQNMSIELLFKIADTLETDPNTILGVKNNVASVDEALNELPLEMKSKLSVLFGAMINQIKEQDVIN